MYSILSFGVRRKQNNLHYQKWQNTNGLKSLMKQNRSIIINPFKQVCTVQIFSTMVNKATGPAQFTQSNILGNLLRICTGIGLDLTKLGNKIYS